MGDQKHSSTDQAETPVNANKTGEPRNIEKTPEAQASTTGAQPGMQRNEAGNAAGHMAGRSEEAGPNPGPGVMSQGHRVDEDSTADGNEKDADRKQPSSSKDMPSSEDPRDQDKDRKDPFAEHSSGDKMPEEAHQNKH